MSVLAFGINHASSPVAVRERLAFNEQNVGTALNVLLKQANIEEAVILSTCNRTEIYTTSSEPEQIKSWLTEHHQLGDFDIAPYCYYHQGLAAVRHLMRVASGLDSMIVGEPQIFGQIKNAFQLACEHGSVGEHMQQLFPAVFATSKHVRSSTNIGRCPVSVAYAVTKLCKETLPNLSACNALLVGAGTTIELVATHLNGCSINNMLVANRTLERAHEIADQYNGTAMRIGDIPQHLDDIDIIITATASQLPILGKGLFERTDAARAHRPLFIADLAVPRDVEPEVGQLSNITLYNIDDLRNVINSNMKDRLSAAEQAESMIELYAASYMRELRIHDASDIIRHYRATMIKQRDCELDKAMSALAAGKNPEAVLKNFARNFVNKTMHHPTVTLRQAAQDGQLNLLALAKELFK
jgi:glutamyl-tRNA reductase